MQTLFYFYLQLFNERQFEMARMCFEKAGDMYNENWARAAGLVERAERHTFMNLEKAHTALQKAAEIYETIRMYDKAAACYIKLGNYAKAGNDSSSYLLFYFFHIIFDLKFFKFYKYTIH
jgi:tetratricopeptide (TPR) repeat protein